MAAGWEARVMQEDLFQQDKLQLSAFARAKKDADWLRHTGKVWKSHVIAAWQNGRVKFQMWNARLGDISAGFLMTQILFLFSSVFVSIICCQPPRFPCPRSVLMTFALFSEEQLVCKIRKKIKECVLEEGDGLTQNEGMKNTATCNKRQDF